MMIQKIISFLLLFLSLFPILAQRNQLTRRDSLKHSYFELALSDSVEALTEYAAKHINWTLLCQSEEGLKKINQILIQSENQQLQDNLLSAASARDSLLPPNVLNILYQYIESDVSPTGKTEAAKLLSKQTRLPKDILNLLLENILNPKSEAHQRLCLQALPPIFLLEENIQHDLYKISHREYWQFNTLEFLVALTSIKNLAPSLSDSIYEILDGLAVLESEGQLSILEQLITEHENSRRHFYKPLGEIMLKIIKENRQESLTFVTIRAIPREYLSNSTIQSIIRIITSNISDKNNDRLLKLLIFRAQLTENHWNEIFSLTTDRYPIEVRKRVIRIIRNSFPIPLTIFHEIITELQVGTSREVMTEWGYLLQNYPMLPSSIVSRIGETILDPQTPEVMRSAFITYLYSVDNLNDTISTYLLGVVDSTKSGYLKQIALVILSRQRPQSSVVISHLFSNWKLFTDVPIRFYWKDYTLNDSLYKLIANQLKIADSRTKLRTIKMLWGIDSLPNSILELLIHELKSPQKDEFKTAIIGRILYQKNISKNQFDNFLDVLLKGGVSEEVLYEFAGAVNNQPPFFDEKRLFILNYFKNNQTLDASFLSWCDRFDINIVEFIPKFLENSLRSRPSKSYSVNDEEVEKFIRLKLYIHSNFNDTTLSLIKWIGCPRATPHTLNQHEGKLVLNIFRSWEESLKSTPLLRAEVLDAIPNIVRVTDDWTTTDLDVLTWALEFVEDYDGAGQETIRSKIESLRGIQWFGNISLGILIHAMMWSILIFLYPKSPSIQAMFFWNKHVRRWAGLGYVNFLITWIPFLRERLFLPFKESLTADAALDQFEKIQYFESSRIFDPIKEETLSLKGFGDDWDGQKIIEGRSGLGKSMFLRNLTRQNRRITAFLPVAKCNEGIVQAIQEKLHGIAKDEKFLQQLIYAGAIDVLIDGLNEISAETRGNIVAEVERFFRGNLLITTQPMEWRPPSTARTYTLEPLNKEQIKEFLTSIYSTSRASQNDKETYQSDCEAYLEKMLGDGLTEEERESHLLILSNPMDLSVVAELIASGESPNLLSLQEQLFVKVQEEYERRSNKKFPLQAFSKAAYEMRVEDRAEIEVEGFDQEIKVLEEKRLVISRQTETLQGEPKQEWVFRHDKIQEFFIVQHFMENLEVLMDEHWGEARFQGVYLLLATKLPYEQAMKLRESLIQQAVDTQDHSLSDQFIKLINTRKDYQPPTPSRLEEVRGYLRTLKLKEAFLRLASFIPDENVEEKNDLTALQARLSELEEIEPKGRLSPSELERKKNVLTQDILAFASRILGN